MMHKQNKTLQKEITKLDIVVKKIQLIMFDLLSTEGKDLEICIENECFKFNPPTNKEEHDQMQLDKCKLITLILRDAFDKYFDEKTDEEVWKNVFALTMGENPKDHKLKKKYKEKLLDPREDGIQTESGHIALPIDENGYQAQQ